MASQDTTPIKEKMLSTIRRRGPSLPVHIAKEANLSILFTSAFLSELVSEKKINISYMRVGSSPVYSLPGQEPLLERFSEYLKSKEKEAFLLLKEAKFLKDIEQEPSISVALREIKDFAIPFKKNDEIFWRYFKIPENQLTIAEKATIPAIVQKPATKKEIQPELNIFDKKDMPKSEKGPKKIVKKPISKKPNEKFFNKVKEFLSKKSIEILDIVGFSKTELFLKVKFDGNEHLLVAYNKKRITEENIIKANKKASELNLPYMIISLGEPVKKLENLISALSNLKKMGKIE